MCSVVLICVLFYDTFVIFVVNTVYIVFLGWYIVFLVWYIVFLVWYIVFLVWYIAINCVDLCVLLCSAVMFCVKMYINV